MGASSLKSRSQFQAVVRTGRRLSDGCLGAYVRSGGDLVPSRLGLVVPGKVGGAVERNLVRRRLRAIWHSQEQRLRPGFEVVVAARMGAAALSYHELEESCLKMLTAAGVLEQGGDRA